jgi:predicted nucleic acid-binding protein
VKTALLDASFLIELEREGGAAGPAMRTLEKLKGHRLFICPVTLAEVLEGAEDPLADSRALSVFHFVTIGWAAAQRCALNQARAPRRMGENDAWMAAIAAHGGMTLVGRDRGFSNRPGLDFVDFMKS